MIYMQMKVTKMLRPAIITSVLCLLFCSTVHAQRPCTGRDIAVTGYGFQSLNITVMEKYWRLLYEDWGATNAKADSLNVRFSECLNNIRTAGYACAECINTKCQERLRDVVRLSKLTHRSTYDQCAYRHPSYISTIKPETEYAQEFQMRIVTTCTQIPENVAVYGVMPSRSRARELDCNHTAPTDVKHVLDLEAIVKTVVHKAEKEVKRFGEKIEKEIKHVAHNVVSNIHKAAKQAAKAGTKLANGLKNAAEKVEKEAEHTGKKIVAGAKKVVKAAGTAVKKAVKKTGSFLKKVVRVVPHGWRRRRQTEPASCEQIESDGGCDYYTNQCPKCSHFNVGGVDPTPGEIFNSVCGAGAKNSYDELQRALKRLNVIEEALDNFTLLAVSYQVAGFTDTGKNSCVKVTFSMTIEKRTYKVKASVNLFDAETTGPILAEEIYNHLLSTAA